jgi:hypothetical protein
MSSALGDQPGDAIMLLIGAASYVLGWLSLTAPTLGRAEAARPSA